MAGENGRTEVQDIIWNIFKEIKQFLDADQITYYMLGGTLLGAVRHGGFIPWDDDLDIGLPREDYEYFLANVEQRLPDYLRLDTYYNNETHHYYFARIVDTRYAVKRVGSEVERQENVWVDIWPLDGMPNSNVIRWLHMIHLLYIRVRYHISTFDKVNLKRPDRPLSERIIIRLIQLTGIGGKSDRNKWLEKIDRSLKKYPYQNSDWLINFMGVYIFKEMFQKKYYGKGKLYAFEDLQLRGPEDAVFVLKQMYGDYMKLPDMADRNAHAAVFEKE